MKNLKLTGVGSYSSPALPGNPILRGQIIRVSDEQAADLLTLSRDALEEDIQIPYFEETEKPFTRDFTSSGTVDTPFEPVPPPAAPAPAPAPAPVEAPASDNPDLAAGDIETKKPAAIPRTRQRS
jgi:hypothetical protein